MKKLVLSCLVNIIRFIVVILFFGPILFVEAMPGRVLIYLLMSCISYALAYFLYGLSEYLDYLRGKCNGISNSK